MVEGLGPALAEKNDSGAARALELSSAFFASFGRTHSPPPTRYRSASGGSFFYF